MLFVPPSMPYMVPEAEGHPGPGDNLTASETECLSLANTSWSPTVIVTCANPFDVTVYMGQRLKIQNPDGGSHSMLPAASYGAPGTYQWSGEIGGDDVTGTINIINPPPCNSNPEPWCVLIQNVSATFSGSEMTWSGDIVNNNNNIVAQKRIYLHVTNDAGEYVASWGPESYNQSIGPNGITESISETKCCLNGPDTGASTLTVYLVNFKHWYGGTHTGWANDAPVYPGTWSRSYGDIISCIYYECYRNS